MKIDKKGIIGAGLGAAALAGTTSLYLRDKNLSKNDKLKLIGLGAGLGLIGGGMTHHHISEGRGKSVAIGSGIGALAAGARTYVNESAQKKDESKEDYKKRVVGKTLHSLVGGGMAGGLAGGQFHEFINEVR